VIPSPVPHSDFVTFTTYKTLMGGRGGVVLCREEYGAGIDRAVFPGCQGTSAVNQIAAKALSFRLAGETAFKQIQQATLDNAVRMADRLDACGYRIVSGGTDNHQVLVDLSPAGVTGQVAESALEAAGMVLNRNVVPADAQRPGKVSGVRLGTSAMAARGMGGAEVDRAAALIHRVLQRPQDETSIRQVRQEVRALCSRFPVVAEGSGQRAGRREQSLS